MQKSSKKIPIPLQYQRIASDEVRVGNLLLGGSQPVRLQTMANVSTDDVEASVAQARRCVEAGAELLRYTTQGEREVENLRCIREQLRREGILIPLVADVHFRADVADKAATVVEKVRINPGNYLRSGMEQLDERFGQLLDLCRMHHTALRIGVNHGSLSERIRTQYGDTPEGMVESCMEFLRIAVARSFQDIVLSIKASDTHIMVRTVRLLVERMHQEQMAFPLHLGVTEAGEGEDGRIKSAVGIGALLADGIGDTIRVSLSEEPEMEISVARALRDYFTRQDSIRYHGVELYRDIHAEGTEEIVYRSKERDWNSFALQAAAELGRLLMGHRAEECPCRIENPGFAEDRCTALLRDIRQAAGVIHYKTEFVSCPGCGRTMFDLQQTVAHIKQAFAGRQDLQPLKIAVMGCIVNGPGEMADADYGYVGAGRNQISLYKGKECILKNIPQENAVQELLKLIETTQNQLS